MRVEVDDRDRAARPRGAEVGERAGVIAADEDRDDARLDDRRDGLLDRGVRPLREAGHDRDVAEVDARQDLERLHVEVRVVRPEHDRRLADGVRPEPAADPVRHPGVERHPDEGDVDVLERPDVRQPGEGRRAGEPRGLERVLGDVAGHGQSLRTPAGPVPYRIRTTWSRWRCGTACWRFTWAAAGFGAPGKRSSPIVGMNVGGTRTFVACSKSKARPISSGSDQRPPVNVIPIGSPASYAAGTVIAP